MNYELPDGHGAGCDCDGCCWNFGYYTAVQDGASEDVARYDYYLGVWYDREEDDPNVEMDDVLRAAEQAGMQAYLLLMATAIYNRAQLQAQQPQPSG